MVKEGPFLNSDKDYPTKCSKLVLSKRSATIVEDMSASSQATSLPAEATKAIQLDKIYQPDKKAIPSVGREISVTVVEEEMPDSVAISSPKNSTALEAFVETSMVDQQCQDDHRTIGASIFPWVFSVAHSSPISPPAKVVTEEKQNGDTLFRISPEKKMSFGMGGSPMQLVPKTSALQERSPSSRRYDYSVENSLPESVGINNFQHEEPQDTHREKGNNEVQNENDEVMENYLKEEVALAKQKLILRFDGLFNF